MCDNECFFFKTMAEDLTKKRINAPSCSDGSERAMEPVAKIPCHHTRTAEIPDTKDNEAAIFKVLNEDCWRILLSYVHLRDLINHKRVSKKWNEKICLYLESVKICLRFSLFPRRIDSFKPADPGRKSRTLAIQAKNHCHVIQLFGDAIVAADCLNINILRWLSHYCPDLEEIRIHPLQEDVTYAEIPKFNKLRRISIMELAGGFCDPVIGKFSTCNFLNLHCETLKELEIVNNDTEDGHCLINLKTELKSLHLENCKNLQPSCLLEAIHCLTDLTKLVLNYNSFIVLEEVYRLIERMPKLEYLELERYTLTSYQVDRLVTAICHLSQLRHLSLYNNKSVTDDWLEAFGTSCRELRAVSIGACTEVTERGLLALCRGAGGSLVALDMSCNNYVTDDDVARCINYCPKLEMLDVQFCDRLTELLAPLAAASARSRAPPCACRGRRPRRNSCPCVRLRPLVIHMPHWLRTHVTYDGIILDFSSDNFKCQGY